MLPEPKLKTVIPKGWTGDMYRDQWNIKAIQLGVFSSLDKLHKKDLQYVNNKLKSLNN